MEDIKINSKGVHKFWKNLKPHKATGPDSIPSCIFKATADQLAPILIELYQTSLNTGLVPQDIRDTSLYEMLVVDNRDTSLYKMLVVDICDTSLCEMLVVDIRDTAL